MTLRIPGATHFPIDILYANKEQLVAETKGKVLQERRIRMSAQPSLQASVHLIA